MSRFTPFAGLICLLLFVHQSAAATLVERPEVKEFINEMVTEHGFDAAMLTETLGKVKLSKSIVEAISRPAEAKPWYKYRPIFLTKDRIKLGVKFLQENQKALVRAEQVYGVPVEIIVAIIGVETRYGKHAGRYKVINSLSTLAFNYPKRNKFFRSELKQFFLLTREQLMDPHSIMGSYAGAMGIPQFISSSYRNYAIDFDEDGKIDIWNNPVDAIGSVGNYFKQHGWQAGKAIATRAEVKNDLYLAALSKGLEPHMRAAELSTYGIMIKQTAPNDAGIKFLEYELKAGREFWLGFDNFYVITRYNHSALYAMAVYQLAEEIRAQYEVQNKL
jgi:peptidoglycan lytic transglycosylase B